MSWYARTGPRRKQTSKFQSQLKLGTDKTAGEEYRGWHYSLVAHQTGSDVRRIRYAVSILDTNKNRVAYLRDCCSIQQAADAAKRWIDQTLGRMLAQRAPIAVGTIPALPELVAAQEK